MTTRTGLEGKITQQMIDDLLKEKGKEYPCRMQWNTEATRDNIRHWSDGVGDLNPLWRNEEYAKKTRWGGIIAPPTFLFTLGQAAGRFGMPGIHNLFAGLRMVFYEPMRLNERITVTGGLHDLVEKKSRWAGRSFVQTSFLNFRNQEGKLLATTYNDNIRGEREATSGTGKYANVALHGPYSQEELEAIWEGIERQEIRGANPRYWEDVHVGQEPIPVVKGPLTVSDMVAFKMGWGSHLVHHMWAHEVRYYLYKRHPAAGVANDLNVMEAPERVHIERDLPKKLGFPTFYDWGMQRVSWEAQMVTNWIGDDGFVKELDEQIRLPSFEGDVHWCRGVVTDKRIKDGEHLVEIKLSATNQRGENTVPGRALVTLPSRSGNKPL